MNIHQVCVTYINEHDRFLVRINTRAHQEVRLWFTRRLTLGLLPLLHQAAREQVRSQAKPLNMADPLTTQRQHMLDNFKQESASYQSDFKTPYQDDGAILPLGPEPLLVTEIKLTPQPNGELHIGILEKIGEQSRHLNMSLDPTLTRGLVSLLDKGMTSSQWLSIETTAALAALTGPASAQTPEADTAITTLETDKPRYKH
jgi:hypothetical protein